MILKSAKDQIKFLTQCKEHIDRMINSNKTKSERKRPNSLVIDDDIANIKGTTLPVSLKMDAGVRNIRTMKLDVLVDIYNEASKNIQGGNELNCETLFKTVKGKNIHKFNGLDFGDFNINSGMQTHRSHFLRLNLFGRFLAFFFKPKSESFLNKYGYFKAEAKEGISKIWDFLGEGTDNQDENKKDNDQNKLDI